MTIAKEKFLDLWVGDIWRGAIDEAESVIYTLNNLIGELK